VTGFGLLGHLLEICEGSGIQAQIEFAKVPVLPHVLDYLAQGCTPGGTGRNFDSYGHKVSTAQDGTLSDTQKMILCDPQTSGGLLAVVSDDAVADFKAMALSAGLALESIGRTVPLGTQNACVVVV
jgi:selenide,water dikinase